MIKLVASDIDGTLVKDGTIDINPEVLDTIIKLHDKGIHVAIATGRHWSSIESVFAPIKNKIFYISDNGAYLGMKDRALFINKMDTSVSNEIIKAISDTGELIAVVATKDGYFIDVEDMELFNWIKEGYRGNIEIVDDLIKANLEVIKISAYSRKPIYKYEDLKNRFIDRVDAKFSGSMWLDFNPKNVNKGNALKILQEALNVGYKESMSFGDQGNDVEMLKSAYYSFAVANATKEAKDVARFETDFNYNDGVLKILKLLI
jgi:hypothetical protein